jgi:hypothetical protein
MALPAFFKAAKPRTFCPTLVPRHFARRVDNKLMPHFRTLNRSSGDVGPDRVRALLADVLRPGHFFVRPPLVLVARAGREELPWEIFRGRLLDPAHTRLRRTFETWSLYLISDGLQPDQPLLSLKFDPAAAEFHVVRAVECYVWEGYHAGDNVYLSRETRKWIRELVGTVPLRQFATAAELKDELISLVFHAVVGASRLPLTSVEAPLPAFSLGELAYCYRAGGTDTPVPSMVAFVEAALNEDLGGLEKAKLLETTLRATPPAEITAAAEHLFTAWCRCGHAAQDLAVLFRSVFNEVALSPYTAFADNCLAFWQALVDRGCVRVEAFADFLSYLLRQVGRHLTAYDLVTFHHRGANYPDALLLDAVLKVYLGVLEGRPDLFAPAAGDPTDAEKRKRLRRRALRQGWLLRRRSEGLPVPEAPTSPGENARVLPPPHVRVPEEQILTPAKRIRRLFADDPWTSPRGVHANELLRQSIADLNYPEELRELGTAIFLDRPLGTAKAPGEPDRTPLVAAEAFSRAIAEDRLRYLAEDLGLIPDPELRAALLERLRQPPAGRGLAPGPRSGGEVPGRVSLEDARRAAEDFIFVRTLPQGVREFLGLFDLTPLALRFGLDYLNPGQPVLFWREGPEPVVTIYDAAQRSRLRLQADLTKGYRLRAGKEYPAAGLRVLGVWELAAGGMQEHALEGEGIVLRPIE